MRALSKDGKLDREAIDTIMNEEKPNQKARIKIPMEKIEKYFPAGTSEKKIEETILKALAKQWGSIQPYSKQPFLCGLRQQRSS